MIENEIANIKDKLGKNLKYILITAIVVLLIALVGIFYFNSEFIITNIMGGAASKLKMKEALIAVLENIYKMAHFHTTSVTDEAQKAAATSFANGNVDTLILTMNLLTIGFFVTEIVVIVGSVFLLVAFKKENTKKAKLGQYLAIGGLSLMAVLTAVTALLLFTMGCALVSANIFYIASAACAVLGVTTLLVIMFGFKKLDKKLVKILRIVVMVLSILGIALAITGLVFGVQTSRVEIASLLSTADLVLIIALFCTSFGLFSMNGLYRYLLPLEVNSVDNELYTYIKELATENVRAKEEKLKKKALR